MPVGYFNIKNLKKDTKFSKVKPDLYFWKKKYMRHTNFVIQTINLDADNKYIIKEKEDFTFRFKIDRNADLINAIYLNINVPEIYSHNGNFGEFAWNEYLGLSMIKHARLYFNDNIIEEIDGEYLYIYNAIFNNPDNKNTFNELVGNINELNKPYINEEYKSFDKNQFDKKTSKIYFLNKFYNGVPSIKKYSLNIPLLFNIFRDNKYVPIISCKKVEIYVEIIFRKIDDWYTIINEKNVILDIPSPSLNELNDDLYVEKDKYKVSSIFNHLSQVSYIKRKQRIKNQNGSILNFMNDKLQIFTPTLNVDYIFLDKDERNFISNRISILHTFVNKYELSNKIDYANFDLNLSHPVKNIIVAARRTDVENTNQWMNFSNLDFNENKPYFFQNNLLNLSKIESMFSNTSIISLLGKFRTINNYNNSYDTLNNDFYMANQSIISLHDEKYINLLNNNHISLTNILELEKKILSLNSNSRLEVVSHNNKNSQENYKYNFLTDTSKKKSINTQNNNSKDLLNINYNNNKNDNVNDKKFCLQKIDIINKGYYLEQPEYKIINNNGYHAKISFDMKNNSINKVHIINKGYGYDENIEFKIKNTYNIEKINIVNGGNEYTSIPNIYLKHNIIKDYDITIKKLKKASIKATIKNNKIDSLIVINHGNNYNKKYVVPTLYIGGNLIQLRDISNLIYDNKYSEPSIRVFDYFNPIIEPKIKCYLNEENKLNLSIQDKGHGLSKHTIVRAGKTIKNIYFKNPIILNNKNSDIDIQFFAKYYPYNTNISKDIINKYFKINNIIDPIVNIKNNKITYLQECQCKIELENKIIINNTQIEYPRVILAKSNRYIIEYNLNSNEFDIKLDIQLQYDNHYTNYYKSFKDKLPIITYLKFNKEIYKEDCNIPIKSIHFQHQDNLLSVNNEQQRYNIKLIKNGILNVTSMFNLFEIIEITKEKKYIITIFNNINSNEIDFQPNDIVSLYIENILIDTVLIKFNNNSYWYGDGIYNSTNLIDKKFKMFFGCFSENVFNLEIGKKIKSIHLINDGIGYKITPDILIQSYSGSKINLNMNMIGGFSINNSFETAIQEEDYKTDFTVDYDGKDAKIKIEFDYGGSYHNLNNYVDIDNKKVAFNNTYYNSYLETQFTSDTIWINYKKQPIFIVKNYDCVIPENYKYQDMIVKGILDYGGTGCEAEFMLDNGGLDGKIKLINIQNNIFKFQLIDSGYGYSYQTNDKLYLTATLIGYNKNYHNKMITDVIIIKQYYLKTKNGLIIKDDESFVYLTSDINSKKIIGINLNNSLNNNYDNLNLDEKDKREYYHIIIGGIINEDLNIVNPGKNYGKKLDKDYIKNSLYNLNLFPNIYHIIFKNTNNKIIFNINELQAKIGISDSNQINKIKIESPTGFFFNKINEKNTFKIPCVQYSDIFELFIPKIKIGSQLTGFEMVDKGNIILNQKKIFIIILLLI